MKKKILIMLISLMSMSTAFSQLSLSVSPGIHFNGASVGYKIVDRFVPYCSVRYLRMSGEYQYNGFEFSSTIPGQINEVNTSNETQTNFLLPTVGLKSFIISKEDLKIFGNISVSKPLVTAHYSHNGVEDDEFADDIKSLKLFAGELGFGMEYFFTNQFSIGGEFGIRYFRVSYDREDENMIYDPYNGIYVQSTSHRTYKGLLSPTYSKVSFNFYF